MKIIVIALAIAVAFLSDRLVREENQRYALLTNMCQPTIPIFPNFECLDKVQTRTSWVWHLFYALTDDLPPVPF